MWHASIARLGLTRTLELSEWKPKNKGRGIRKAKTLIGDLGIGPFDVEEGGCAIHVRRALTPEEAAQLPWPVRQQLLKQEYD